MIAIDFDHSFPHGGVNVYVREWNGRTKTPYRIMIERLPSTAEGSRIEPACFIEDDQVKPIFDALVGALQRYGALPKPDSAEAELEATKIHLQDMRKLTFDLVERTLYERRVQTQSGSRPGEAAHEMPSV